MTQIEHLWEIKSQTLALFLVIWMSFGIDPAFAPLVEFRDWMGG